MEYPEIYNTFERTSAVSDGESVYDFLGGKINARFKHNWDKNLIPEGKTVSPNYPPLSEWTADWVASLLAAKTANERFTVVELGAGYGQWMVTGILAFKALNPEGAALGIAVEADATHYDWLQENVTSNLSDHKNIQTSLLRAAAGSDGVVEFPVIKDPSKDYGASYSMTGTYDEVEEVPSMSLHTVYEDVSGPIDLLHVDIQGAEIDLIEHPQFLADLGRTRMVLFGTHRSEELHGKVRQKLLDAGLCIKLDWPRNSQIHTKFGEIQTNDGALLAMDSETSTASDQLMDLSVLRSTLD